MTRNGFRTFRISEGRCQLEYCIKKNHPELPWMVFLHGFGQDSRAFEDLFGIYENSHNLLSLHIFYHGESWIEGKKPLEIEEWLSIWDRLLEKENVKNPSIWAYSMGAKFALTSAIFRSNQVGPLFLMAPDGMVMNPWYAFATQNQFGRKILAISYFWMPVFRPIFWMLSKVGLVRPALARFAWLQMATLKQRKQVVRVWLRFRKIWPNPKMVRQLVAEKKIKIHLILGKFDPIIRPALFKKLQTSMPEMEVLLLESGHSRLVEKMADILKKA